MFGIGASELLVIAAIAFLVLGPEKIIALSRTLGKGWGRITRSREEIERAVLSELKKAGSETTPGGDTPDRTGKNAGEMEKK